MLKYSVILLFCLIFLKLHEAIHNTAPTYCGPPHNHRGLLKPFDGKQLRISLSKEEEEILSKGSPVLKNKREGNSGLGIVIQDVDAPASMCMERIANVEGYPGLVPSVKKVNIYDAFTFANGTKKFGAEFFVGSMGLNFKYYLQLRYEPKYNTLTWTLDYDRKSDFDDNVGHWQVMDHPFKKDASRILYSTQIKLLTWVPDFLISKLTTKTLVDSTSWVKREAEADFCKRRALPVKPITPGGLFKKLFSK